MVRILVDCSVLGVGKKSVEQWCFSIGEKVNSAEKWCFSIRRGKAKQLLDRVVSSMKDGEGMEKKKWQKGCRAMMGKKGVSLVFQ
jgi:hypothetical protein